MVHRDIYLLKFEPAQATKLDEWRVGTCVMSTAASAGDWLAFESKDHITLSRVDDPAKGKGLGQDNPKHPSIAAAPDGRVLVAWTEKTGWNRGGLLAWQLIGADGKVLDGARSAEKLPAWDYPAAVALPDGRFVIFY